MTLNVTPDQTPAIIPPAAADPVQNPEPNRPSTAGMTAKVIKGSVWTLAGQIAPLAISLITTPFIIRLLGTESYGVLLLIGLIPTYLTFSDLGMGVTSTKFASEALGKGDQDLEARTVRTAAMIAVIGSITVALPVFFAAEYLVRALNVPEALQTEAVWGLRLILVATVLGVLANTFNSPQLSRLRMDINAAVNGGTKIVLGIATVTVLFWGWGIQGAVVIAVLTAIAGNIVNFTASARLLPRLWGVTIEPGLVRPMLKMGIGLVFASLAMLLLTNTEKLILTRLASVESLAYYSVAFTFANTATMFSWGMVQSLIPAFSQILAGKRFEEFNALFSRTMRINLIWLPPSLMFLFVIAEPFLTLWAGPEFGANSTAPFYILLAGLFFNILAYVPYSVLTATGRTNVLAMLYWAEVVIYIILAYVLIERFQLIGAALAWSIRIVLDAFLVSFLSKRLAGASFGFVKSYLALTASLLCLLPPFVAILYFKDSLLAIILAPLSAGAFLALSWWKLLDKDERIWATAKARAII